MATRTRPTGLSRFLFVLIVMAALFFGVQYAITSTDWGRDLHQRVIDAAPADGDADPAPGVD